MKVATPIVIPILIMSYNDLPCLRLCLRAIVNRTNHPHQLIVVDNASSNRRLQRYLALLSRLTRCRVFINSSNLWVLGLNRPLREALSSLGPDNLFAVSDCDIIVPPPRGGQCWLTRMVATMDTNVCIGKLGLSLDLGYIKSRPQFQATYDQEKFFLAGPPIADAIVAGVDTTMALYRQSLFVTRQPRFMPGHQSLHRPYYYCCRTQPDFCAKHLSWRGYGSRANEDVVAKLVCMAVLGTSIAPHQLAIAPAGARLLYRLVKPLARIFWGAAMALLQSAYTLRTYPRGANQVQHARRGR